MTKVHDKGLIAHLTKRHHITTASEMLSFHRHLCIYHKKVFFLYINLFSFIKGMGGRWKPKESNIKIKNSSMERLSGSIHRSSDNSSAELGHTQTTDPSEAHRTILLLLKCAVHIHVHPAFVPVEIE